MIATTLRLHETFDAYKAAESTAMQAFIAYKFGEVSEKEVHRLQRLSSLAHTAHIEAMNAVAGEVQ